MKPSTPLQSVVDPFVRGLGGELISELVGNDNPPPNADYLFRRHNVIAELKSLQGESFSESVRKKLGDRMAEWLRRSSIVIRGRNRIDSRQFTPECQREMADLIAAHLQNNVVKSANRQIASTKQILSMPDAKGLLWVASDGDTGLQPLDVWSHLARILRKKGEGGRPQYSNIHALAYFNPRMLAKLPGILPPATIWFSGCRDSDDQQLALCLTELQQAWPKYVAATQGTQVIRVRSDAVPPEEIRFWDASPQLPQIQVNDSRRGK